MNVSGAEAVVAAASPWIGQGKLDRKNLGTLAQMHTLIGESACLVRPYVDRKSIVMSSVPLANLNYL
jgi:hypothetical protein